MAEPAPSNVIALPRPEPVVRGKEGLYSAASLGLDPATCGPGFSPAELYASERYARLTAKERYFRGEQHDAKVFDFEQRLQPAPSGVQPLMGGMTSGSYIALDQRRPSSPYRLARQVVKGFTTLVFGRGSFPAVRVVGDKDTQLFAEALVKACKLPSVMVRARTLGGACGTVGLSWRFWQGLPRVQVHNARALHVFEWEDREQLIPGHITELTQYQGQRIGEKGKREPCLFWRRRDWTKLADITFVDVEVDADEEPEWVIDEVETVVHGDDFTHFVWVQNIPDLDGSCEDGECDLESLHPNLDMVDVLTSVTASGAAKNLDPTLVLDISRDDLGNSQVSKGSDNAIAFTGAANSKYLEISGASVTAGKDLIAAEVQRIKEVSGYVSPDPDKIAAAGTSGVAIELLFAPMLMAGQTYREQYGSNGIERILDGMIASARRRMPTKDPATGELVYPVELGPDGEETEVDFFVSLPPRVIEEPVLDANGQPTGEVVVRSEELRPGAGGDVELEWGPFFPASSTEKQAQATTLTTANGGKPVLSHQTSVEQWARNAGLDPVEEWKRVKAQLDADKAAQVGMFPDAGMPVAAPQTPPVPTDETPDDDAAE